MADLLSTLVKASERAARVARACCLGSSNETLLIAEKFEGDANVRFERDFKTIADVLAQESAKTEIATQFPTLAEYVRGEECSEMGGVRIAVQDSIEKTVELLSYLVTLEPAKRMADAVHADLDLHFTKILPKIQTDIDISDIGIWIDPIDATAEFIAGVRGEANSDRGLPCVTVLIGAYLRSTGEPVVGVINQPFFNEGKGRIIWGVHYGEIRECGGTETVELTDNNTILMSGAEKPEIIEKVRNAGWDVKSVPGAGHKLMKVALGEAAAYIVSQGTTFLWDTCAPHAILRAKGGDLFNFKTLEPITYNNPVEEETQKYCNSDGIIAFPNASVFERLKDVACQI